MIEATLDPGSATQVWWSARETGPTAAPRDVRTARRREDARHHRRRRCAPAVARRPHDRAGRAGAVRSPDSGRLRARGRHRRLARSAASSRASACSLFVSAPARRRHQFLLNLERSGAGGSFKLETGFPTVPAAQRETGEVAIEGIGTLEIAVNRRSRACGGWTCAKSIRRSPRWRGSRCSRPIAISARTSGVPVARAQRHALPRRRGARGDRRPRRRHDAPDERGPRADRGLAPASQPRAAVHEGGAAAGRDDAVGRRRRRRRRSRPKAPTACASRCSAPASGPTGRTPSRSSTCTRERRSPRRATCR